MMFQRDRHTSSYVWRPPAAADRNGTTAGRTYLARVVEASGSECGHLQVVACSAQRRAAKCRATPLPNVTVSSDAQKFSNDRAHGAVCPRFARGEAPSRTRLPSQREVRDQDELLDEASEEEDRQRGQADGLHMSCALDALLREAERLSVFHDA